MHVPPNFEWELLVVDNNSTERTPEVIEEFSKRAPMAVRYLPETVQGCRVRQWRGPGFE
jgi:glycosyltransferase involved in cell wall biosynthesis